MASTQIETVSTGADKAKLVIASALVVGALAAFYLMAGQGGWAQWGGLVGGLILAAIVFFTAEMGRRLVAYARDSWRETQKVVWPTRKVALQTTAFVFAFSVAIAVFLWGVDKVLEWSLYDLILGWKR